MGGIQWLLYWYNDTCFEWFRRVEAKFRRADFWVAVLNSYNAWKPVNVYPYGTSYGCENVGHEMARFLSELRVLKMKKIPVIYYTKMLQKTTCNVARVFPCP